MPSLCALRLLTAATVCSALVLPARGALTAEQAKGLGRDAYYYAYPIVVMDITTVQATNVPNATAVPMRAPVNRFAHFRTYPKADSRDIVRFNFDTLYSFAWLDLSKEPIILSVPDSGGRYYLVPMLDMWTDVFAVPGTRTTAGKARQFAIAAPGWKGKLPKGVELIQAPTSRVWVMGRTQTNGPADYDAVHKVQDAYTLTPLSRWGRRPSPANDVPIDAAIDNTTPPLVQVNKLSGVEMLARLAELLKKYPPHAEDYPILMRLQALGLVPGQTFDVKKLDPITVQAINDGAKEALADMQRSISKLGTVTNGWTFTTQNIGTYGTSYKQRAIIAMAGLGANLPEDAVYPTAFVDGNGQRLSGANHYVLHFDKGQLPPADAFWSITLYDKDGFQVANPIDRFAIGDRDGLAFNVDGSLDIYVQSDSPGADKQANWLPAPKDGPFALTMRIYSPRREVLDGTWSPPPVKALSYYKP